ncbi:hypothetical protein [Salinarimonas soli]|uniref:Fe-S oxidoreductase n=1 Tax=Salinarimonas soli TaxID=1638099 RepID=A0A5B2VED8_9HYPH|nr:hypothetical protein [Salinarimonas soli]KAA2237165.1 hypothetical protein F0L46_09115 [Salinarimonas soli]
MSRDRTVSGDAERKGSSMKSIILAAAIACLGPVAALAQQAAAPPSNATAAPSSPGNAGVEQPVKTGDLSVPERGALPAAQGATRSAAPGTQIDCVKTPAQCSEPVTSTGSAGPSPGVPTQSK